MHFMISVYKDTGKWYTDFEVKTDRIIELHKSEFKEFIRDCLPAHCKGGFVVVNSCDDDSGFHNVLYKYDELSEVSSV